MRLKPEGDSGVCGFILCHGNADKSVGLKKDFLKRSSFFIKGRFKTGQEEMKKCKDYKKS